MLLFRRYARSRRVLWKQIKNFSARNAKCRSESDRPFVQSTIQQLYGTEESFDSHVRTTFSDFIMAHIGRKHDIPFFFSVRSVSTMAVVWFADACLSMEEVNASYIWNWVGTFAIVHLVYLPLLVQGIYILARLRLKTHSTQAEVAVVLVLAFAGSVTVSLWFVLMAVTLEMGMLAKIACAASCAALLRLQKVCRVCGRLLRGSSGLSDGDGGSGQLPQTSGTALTENEPRSQTLGKMHVAAAQRDGECGPTPPHAAPPIATRAASGAGGSPLGQLAASSEFNEPWEITVIPFEV